MAAQTPPRKQLLSAMDQKKIIDATGLSGKKLAELLGVSASTVKRWKSGKQTAPNPVLKLLLLTVEHRNKHGPKDGRDGFHPILQEPIILARTIIDAPEGFFLDGIAHRVRMRGGNPKLPKYRNRSRNKDGELYISYCYSAASPEYKAPTVFKINFKIKHLNCSNRWLANKLGVSERTIRKWRSGERRINYAAWRLICLGYWHLNWESGEWLPTLPQPNWY